jgi:hypothetical protein
MLGRILLFGHLQGPVRAILADVQARRPSGRLARRLGLRNASMLLIRMDQRLRLSR